MPKFSNWSIRQLLNCNDDLRALAHEAIKHYDFKVVEGHRSIERQKTLYEQGLSKIQPPNSMHNAWKSLAYDLAPCPIDFNNTIRFYHFGGFMKGLSDHMGIQIRWGGDWDSDTDLHDQNFMDFMHFELVKSPHGNKQTD